MHVEIEQRHSILLSSGAQFPQLLLALCAYLERLRIAKAQLEEGKRTGVEPMVDMG